MVTASLPRLRPRSIISRDFAFSQLTFSKVKASDNCSMARVYCLRARGCIYCCRLLPLHTDMDMKPTIPSTHLLRHFVLFAFVALFLLTMIRAGYGLWQFPAVLESEAWYSLFLTGLRYDLALIGGLLLVPMIVGPLLGMLGVTRLIAKSFLIIWLVGALGYILVTEYITPYFILESGIRPDLAVLAVTEEPIIAAMGFVSAHFVPALIGILLMLMIFLAYARRLEITRLLAYRLSVGSSIALLILGSAVCLLAIRSEYDPGKPALSPGHSLISKQTLINEISMNTGYKIAYSTIQPYFSK